MLNLPYQGGLKIRNRFKNAFKQPFKSKDSPLLTLSTPSKKDFPVTKPQTKEVKLRLSNLNYRLENYSINPAIQDLTCLLQSKNVKNFG